MERRSSSTEQTQAKPKEPKELPARRGQSFSDHLLDFQQRFGDSPSVVSRAPKGKPPSPGPEEHAEHPQHAPRNRVNRPHRKEAGHESSDFARD